MRFLQRMMDLYNQAETSIDGIVAIQKALEFENPRRSDDEKLSLKEVSMMLGLGEQYNGYALFKELSDWW